MPAYTRLYGYLITSRRSLRLLIMHIDAEGRETGVIDIAHAGTIDHFGNRTEMYVAQNVPVHCWADIARTYGLEGSPYDANYDVNMNLNEKHTFPGVTLWEDERASVDSPYYPLEGPSADVIYKAVPFYWNGRGLLPGTTPDGKFTTALFFAWRWDGSQWVSDFAWDYRDMGFSRATYPRISGRAGADVQVGPVGASASVCNLL